MACVLAIDQSTSATKAALFDLAGDVLDSATRKHQQHYPQPGWVEHDAEEIWRNTLAVTGELLARQAERIADLACISIANQRETIVVFERGTGRPLCPAIVWQCRRGDYLCATQIQLQRDGAVRKRTGLRIDGYFSASKLQWLMRERADLAAMIARGQALIGTIDSYVIYRLTEGAVFATDHTNASRTLLYDIDALRWDEEFCSWWQVPHRALAEVRPSAAHFGDTTLGGQLPSAVPIRGVMGDSQASLFAHRCLEAGSAKVTFGTGSSVLLNVGHVRPLQSQGAVATLAWVHEGKPTYALEGLINCSAAAVAWVRDQLGLFDAAVDVGTVAREVEDDEHVYLVPAFSGLGAPYWREAARGAIVGLSAFSDRRHIVKAALESMAYQLRDVLDMMRVESGLELRQIHADGGPTANDFLMQFTADIVGAELHVARVIDHSARGAALMGALGMGLYASMAELSKPDDGTVIYQRRMAPDRANARYSGWRRAVEQVLCVA